MFLPCFYFISYTMLFFPTMRMQYISHIANMLPAGLFDVFLFMNVQINSIYENVLYELDVHLLFSITTHTQQYLLNIGICNRRVCILSRAHTYNRTRTRTHSYPLCIETFIVASCGPAGVRPRSFEDAGASGCGCACGLGGRRGAPPRPPLCRRRHPRRRRPPPSAPVVGLRRRRADGRPGAAARGGPGLGPPAGRRPAGLGRRRRPRPPAAAGGRRRRLAAAGRRAGAGVGGVG
jgi:hypothetical protein